MYTLPTLPLVLNKIVTIPFAMALTMAIAAYVQGGGGGGSSGDDDDDDETSRNVQPTYSHQTTYHPYPHAFRGGYYGYSASVWIWTWIMVALGGIVILICHRKMKAAYAALRNFNHLPHLPILGSIHLVTGNMRVRVQKALKLMKMAAQNSPIVFWFSYVPVVVLATSEHIQMVSNKMQDRYVLGFFENVLKDGILLAQGEQWKTIRRIMNPAFSGAMLSQYMIVFNEQAAILVKQLAKRADTDVVTDLWQYVSDMNFDTVTENMTDYKLHAQEQRSNEFSEAVKDALHLESQRLNNPILFFDIFFTMYRYWTGKKDLYKKINELPAKIVRQKMQKYESEKPIINKDRTKEKPMRSLIDFLLRVHDTYPEFDENRMRIEILNMIFAGSDTTATTVSLALLFLAIHPEIQEKVYREIQQVFEDDPSATVQMHHCVQLKYTEQCIKETLRRFSLVPITARRCPEPVKIDDELIIPANCMISFGYHAVHHDPTLHPDPDNFDPDRFSPQNVKTKIDFMGFGVGPRACIGSKYAMLSMKTQIVHVLREYRLSAEITMPDIVHIVDMLSRSQNGYPVKIWSRNN